jgi:hypothetical protein
VRRVRLRDKSPVVQHHRVVGARHVRLDLGQDRGEQVVVVDLGVQGVRGVAPDARRDQADPGPVVDRVLELGQHDQRRPGDVEPGIHARGELDAAGQRQADVDAGVHRISGQRPADLGHEGLAGGHGGEPQGVGRPAQPGQVLLQREDPAVGQPQALPDRVAALHDGIERGHPRLVPVRQAAADVDDQVAVALVELLQQWMLPGQPRPFWIPILFLLSRS